MTPEERARKIVDEKPTSDYELELSIADQIRQAVAQERIAKLLAVTAELDNYRDQVLEVLKRWRAYMLEYQSVKPGYVLDSAISEVRRIGEEDDDDA